MCGRYALYTSTHEIPRLVGINRQIGSFLPRYNVAPGTAVVNVHHRLITAEPGIETHTWGFVPHWAPADWNGPRPINARDDKLVSSRMYRAAFRGTPGGPNDSLVAGRSLIFADGFYEPDKSDSRPYPQYYFWPREGGLIAFAGLFACWRAAPSDSLYVSCTIITTAPNATVGAVHPRMPAILSPSHCAAWIDPEYHDTDALAAMLGPAPDDLLAYHRVDERLLNRRVEDGRWYDGPNLIERRAS